MIPEFPKFKKLELSDKKEVEKFTSKFPPYSDFNFCNMWSWDFKKEMGLSVLNDNLIIRFTDYLNGQPFFSFIGTNMLTETVEKLLVFSEKNYKTEFLKLIPKTIIDFLDGTKFHTIPDANSSDYIYTIAHLANMDKWSDGGSGKRIKHFIEKHSNYVIKECSIKEISENEYLNIFKKWAENKKIENLYQLNEYKAFKRMLEISSPNLRVISLCVDNIMIGFTVFEIITNKYALSHFAKADKTFDSAVYDVMNWEEAKILQKKGVEYYNYEQDLGIDELKKSKIKYHPDSYLEKFIVQKIN